MELLEGQTLAERLAAGKPALADVLRWSIEIADGLPSGAPEGHRPPRSSSRRTSSSRRDGEAKILDFGLAKFVTGDAAARFDADQTEHGQASAPSRTWPLSRSAARHVDTRADIFSLGIVIYEMAAGKRPFDAATSGMVFDAILNRAPHPSPLEPELQHVIVESV